MPTRQTADYDPLMDELPPDLAAEYMAERRRRKISEAMLGQSQTPLVAPEVKGRFQGAISPFQGLAQVAKAYMANKGLEGSDAAMADIGRRKQEAYTSDIDRISKVMTGRPENMQGQNYPAGGNPDEQGGMGYQAAVPAGSAEQVAQAMMASKFPSISKHGFGQLDAAQKQKQVAIDKLEQIEAAAREGRITREAAAVASADLRRELQSNQFAQQKSMAQLAAGLRQDPAPTVTEIVKDGKTLKVDARTGRVIGDAPMTGKGKGMTPTAQKELIQTDEEIQGGQAALTSLGQARAINDKAMGFKGAGVVSSLGTLLPEGIRPEAVDATENLDNILTAGALPQLKAIFGGMPTEGERKVLLEIQGSSSKSPAVRKQIFDRAEAAVKQRIEFSKGKAKSLRDGTYFSDNGTPASSGSNVDALLEKYK